MIAADFCTLTPLFYNFFQYSDKAVIVCYNVNKCNRKGENIMFKHEPEFPDEYKKELKEAINLLKKKDVKKFIFSVHSLITI